MWVVERSATHAHACIRNSNAGDGPSKDDRQRTTVVYIGGDVPRAARTREKASMASASILD